MKWLRKRNIETKEDDNPDVKPKNQILQTDKYSDVNKSKLDSLDRSNGKTFIDNLKKSNDGYLDKKVKLEHKNYDYSRPNWRSGIRDEVWENAKDVHGRVRDPITGKYMSKEKPWDIGHKPGYEFKKHQKSAEARGIDRKTFINEYNNPNHLRPELPSSNRSHKGENKTNEYFGN